MEEIIPKKKGRGGARPGAGRPRKNIVKSYAFHAPPEVHEILEKVQGSKSEFICQCILKAAQLPWAVFLTKCASGFHVFSRKSL